MSVEINHEVHEEVCRHCLGEMQIVLTEEEWKGTSLDSPIIANHGVNDETICIHCELEDTYCDATNACVTDCGCELCCGDGH